MPYLQVYDVNVTTKTKKGKGMKTYSTEYDQYTIHYQIDSDCDGNHAILKSITTECGSVSPGFFDKETLADMKFICESEFSDLQLHHYLKTGETL